MSKKIRKVFNLNPNTNKYFLDDSNVYNDSIMHIGKYRQTLIYPLFRFQTLENRNDFETTLQLDTMVVIKKNKSTNDLVYISEIYHVDNINNTKEQLQKIIDDFTGKCESMTKVPDNVKVQLKNDNN